MESMHTPIQSPHEPTLLHETRYPDTLHGKQGAPQEGTLCRDVQGGSSGGPGLCRHVHAQETAWTIDNVEMTLLHCDSYLSTCTSNRSVWMSFLMNWNTTHTSSGVSVYDTCMFPMIMCHFVFITKKGIYKNRLKLIHKKIKGEKYKVQSAKCY